MLLMQEAGGKPLHVLALAPLVTDGTGAGLGGPRPSH